ncbi:RluA family pseudouridine synthase [Caldimonas sp. KR1-144]|uniref:RluA family pseudouridine synthase n=1 Tax=Caldimonas sp. KR1-144 TaxID=3400911 RepID=UPI003C083AC3
MSRATLDWPAAPGEDDAAAPDDDAFELREGQVDAAGHGERLDRWLVALAPEFSRSYLQQLIEAGEVCVDAAAQRTPAKRLSAGQRVAVRLVPTPQSRAFRAEPMALAVVHEDEHLLVIDKPAGLVVHPAAGHWSGTLLNGLLAHHAGAASLPRAGIVHRLDKDTSGLMAVGKTLAAVTALVRAIAAREVHREYLAIVHGEPREAAFTVDAPIGRDPASRVRMAVVASGKSARTDVQCLASGAIEGGRASVVRCTLHTGRTHQIRVHLASRGHPLVADALYGGAPALGMSRQALHARRLAFEHPHDARALRFEALPPADLRSACHAISPMLDV